MKKISQAQYSPEIVRMMDETNICLCCGQQLKYLDKEKRRNRGYCSLKCFYDKPARYAYIEKLYSMSVKEFIIKELNRTDSVEVVANLIGVNKQSLYKYIQKHMIRRTVRWKAS